MEEFQPPTIVEAPDGIAAVFSPDGRVFYDLEALVGSVLPTLETNSMVAMVTGDDKMLGECAAVLALLTGFEASRIDLQQRFAAFNASGDIDSLEAAFSLPDADEPDYGQAD